MPSADASPFAAADVRAIAGRIPAAVLRVLEELDRAGHAAFLVGGCVRDLLQGLTVRDFDVATAAAPERVLEVFPRAVPTGLRHGTVMVPTPVGPVDVTSFRAGPELADDLAHRDFTVNAIAWDPREDRIVDPFGGRADLAAGRLRAVGAAPDRLAEDPLRALRAVRLAAVLGLTLDAGLEAALAGAAPRLRDVARERVRRELEGLLLAPGAGAGLARLRRCGLEAVLVGETSPDAPAVVAALPHDLVLRLAGWLRGLRARPLLGRLRFPRRVAAGAAELLLHHPVDAGVLPESDTSVRRMLKRVGEEHVDPLIALREAELTAAAPCAERDAALRTLAALRAAVERVRRSGTLALRRLDLALDGRAVMQILGCGPGREVGRALRALTEAVVEDPGCNTPEGLRQRLRAWKAAGSPSA